ncbi:MAG: NAD-dependent epimerase/dehydratase family protein [Chloroflexota bacterium]
MKRVLVTGASGFIGRHVVASLGSAGWTVRTLHRGNPIPGIKDHVAADVTRDPLTVALRDISAVIHLAGLGDIAASTLHPLDYNLVNAVGTLQILEAARQSNATVVLASSQHVYRPSARRLTEQSPPRPQNVYGVSKMIAERWCEMYGQEYGLPTRAVRLFSVYGPGQVGQGASGVVSIFTERATRDEPIIVMSGQRRDFTHVHDVVRGLIAALDYSSTGYGVFNIGTGVGTNFGNLALLIRELLSSSSDVDTSRMSSTSKHLIPSVERARVELGFASQISLLEGLQDYFDWTRKAAIRFA